MKKKGKHLFGILAMTAALIISTGTSDILVSAAEINNSAQTPEEKAPVMPASYELEIQSNNIPGWPQGPKVVAETAILMDLDTGEILYSKGIDEKRAPASTTKIMTAMLAIEKVPLDTKITFTEEVYNIEPDSTHIGIKPGETLTMEESLYGILLGSANEVSSGVAEYIGGTVPAFVEMMNQRAKDLGCENTHFVNANGLWHEDHYTTARDLAIISKAAFENETFRNIVKTTYYIIPITNLTNETRWINNHHKMILQGEHFYEGCLGGKTGYTVKANNTLVTYAERNDMRLVCVVLNDVGGHYSDTKAILDYGFNNFQKVKLTAESLKADDKDSIISHLKEQGLLTVPLQSTMVEIPSETSQELTSKATLNENTLEISAYYGDTLISSTKMDASQEILDTVNALNQTEAPKKTAPEPEKEKPVPTQTDNSEDNDSLGNFWKDAAVTFKELPNWKYPVSAFLLCAFIVYIISLVVKIKRMIKKHKRKKLRKKDKERASL